MIFVIFLIIAVLLILLIIFVMIGMYNNLVALNLKLDNSWSLIETNSKKIFDTIPNLVKCVKNNTKYENDTIEEILNSKAMFEKSQNTTEKINSIMELTKNLEILFTISEAYPELEENKEFLEFKSNFSKFENELSNLKKEYNNSVLAYNTSIKSFPTEIVAKIFKFYEKTFFEGNTQVEKEI